MKQNIDDVDFWLNNPLDTLSHITLEGIETALLDFALPCLKRGDWLTATVRRVHFGTVNPEVDAYPGKATVRAELLDIADAISTLREKLKARSGWAESVLRRYTINDPDYWPDRPGYEESNDDNETWWESGSRHIAHVSPWWERFRNGISDLEFLETYISQSVDKLCGENDAPRWRDSEKRRQRINFATHMSLVFETAYDAQATVNNWEGEDGQPVLGPWPEFFERIATVALQTDRVPDLVGTLKEARKQFLKERERLDYLLFD